MPTVIYFGPTRAMDRLTVEEEPERVVIELAQAHGTVGGMARLTHKEAPVWVNPNLVRFVRAPQD